MHRNLPATTRKVIRLEEREYFRITRLPYENLDIFQILADFKIFFKIFDFPFKFLLPNHSLYVQWPSVGTGDCDSF